MKQARTELSALIIDDDRHCAEMVATLLHAQGYRVAVAPSLFEARQQLAKITPHLVLLEFRLPDGSGLSLFADNLLTSKSKVVLTTRHATLQDSLEALRLGALDYLIKPITPGNLKDVLARANHFASVNAQYEYPAPAVGSDCHYGRLIGRSEPMQRVYRQVDRVAPTSVTVFITGESGTGKELVAQTVHNFSRRRERPLLAVNCGAISPNLLESEIFGHEKGSFTGADLQHQGFFERANGGTLFLDELTEMPMPLQVKLLRLLETGTFMRVGSTQTRHTDVRIIAATNRDPRCAVAAGLVREDLLHRLNVFPVTMPPLRERLDDVPLLTDHLLLQIGQREGRIKRIDALALDRLEHHPWPGNVRELRNVLQRAYVMAENDTITMDWLPADMGHVARANHPTETTPLSAQESATPSGTSPPGASRGIRITLGTPLATVEQQLILQTLRHFGNHREKTAMALGVTSKTLYNKLKHYESQAKKQG